MATRRTPSIPKGKKTGIFKSQFEAEVARWLRMWNVEFEYEPVKLPYAVVRDYKPDFVLSNNIHVETKGYFQSSDQRKMRAIKEQYPDLDIRMVFQRLNGRVQGSQMTNKEWCEKYGFPYAEGKIPKEWTNEQAKAN
jgi:predicted nuclease of restriction endonuclease-like RecB superfamily